MSRVRLGIWSCMLMAVGMAIGCAERRGEEREAPMHVGDQSEPEDIGSSAQALEGTYCIINAKVAGGSFHFEGPRWLIDSVEGYGPQRLTLTVDHRILPQISTTLTPKPSVNDIASAVGYSLSDGARLVAASQVQLDEGKFMRLEAYTAFQKTTWEVRDAGCNAYLGSGITYKPIGIYFELRNIVDVGLPDVGIYTGGAGAGGPDEVLGGTYCIINAKVAGGSFHFEGPRWLIDSVEGYGPQTLTLVIDHVIWPQISTTLTRKPSVNDITSAVGYSLLDGYDLAASSQVQLDEGKFMRLEAYTAFQKTTWEVRDADCNAYLGSGITYKPIGIYFELRNIVDVGLPDVGIYTAVPDCPGGICAGAGDAGAGDAGAGDAGAGDAGASDGGTDGGETEAGAKDGGP